METVLEYVQENATAIGLGVGTALLTGASAVGYYLLSPPDPIRVPIDLGKQADVLPDGVYASPFLEDGKLMDHIYHDCRTLYEGFQRGMRVSNNGKCLGSRTGPNKEYEWLTYKQVFQRAHRFGSGLLQLGMKPGPDSFLGIYSNNRLEWVLAEQGCNIYSMVIIPLYDTLGPNACAFIINQAEISTVVCDKPEKAQQLLEQADKIPHLKCIIMMDPVSNNNTLLAEKHNIKLYSFAEVEDLGRRNLRDPVPPKPSDLATICYTSGTTGDPKGVMLTHSNLTASIASVTYFALHGMNLSSEDCHLSYLPLAHMFERGSQFMIFCHGAHIGFYQGDVRKILDDLQTLKPTLFPTVPRLLNRLYDRVQLSVKGSKFKSWLLKTAISQKEKEIRRFIVRRNSIWDILLFRKLQNLLGGRVKVIITGSAPLSTEVLTFVRCALGCIVVEGYGQTEATAGITFQLPGEYSAGNVGGPLPCNFVKLVDVPDMDYHAADGKGEICARGPNVFSGYYKNHGETGKVMDSDGWLHTGDIGMWLPNGTLKIIDRKKNIFKLAQGEYVAPEKCENVYLRSRYISQVFVHGDSLKTCTVGIVVPDMDVFPGLLKELGLSGDATELCSHKDVKKHIFDDMMKNGKEAGLHSFELVKDIFISSEPFTSKNGCLTPTFKNKRPALLKKFTKQIEEMYKRIGK